MSQSRRWLLGYYLATPLFWLADVSFGSSVRVVALDAYPGWKLAYYGVCLLCAAAMWRGMRGYGLIALGECTLNLLLLSVAILLPQIQLAEAISRGETVLSSPITPELVMNFLAAGTIWTLAFYARLYDLMPGRPPLGQLHR